MERSRLLGKKGLGRGSGLREGVFPRWRKRLRRCRSDAGLEWELPGPALVEVVAGDGVGLGGIERGGRRLRNPFRPLNWNPGVMPPQPPPPLPGPAGEIHRFAASSDKRARGGRRGDAAVFGHGAAPDRFRCRDAGSILQPTP